MKGFCALADIIRGGTGGGVFVGDMTAWILELSLSLNLSIAGEVSLLGGNQTELEYCLHQTVELLCLVYRKVSEECSCGWSPVIIMTVVAKSWNVVNVAALAGVDSAASSA